MANVVSKLTMKVFTLAVGIPIGILVKRTVERIWHSARPAEPPRDPHQAGVRWGDALGWAALSGAAVVAKDLLTRRGAEEAWRFVVGTEPPPAPPTKAEKKLAKAQQKVAVGDDD
jgi:hypothetical protein